MENRRYNGSLSNVKDQLEISFGVPNGS